MTTPDPTFIDLPEATIRSISVSEMDNNVYLITVRSTGAQVLVDAADDARAIGRLVAAGRADADPGAQAGLRLVVTTHSHWDHVRALADVLARSEALAACGEEDEAAIDATMDFTLADGDTADLEGLSLDVIGLRGHTPGSIALALQPAEGPAYLFTGDSLFPGGVGKTTSPEDFRSLLHDVRTRIFDVYPDETVVLPGHGRPTTLGAERPHLDEWEERGW